MTLGTAIVLFVAGGMIVGLFVAMIRNDVYHIVDTPSCRNIAGALISGKKLPSAWKTTNKDNQAIYTVMAFCLIGLVTLLFTYRHIIWFIDQL